MAPVTDLAAARAARRPVTMTDAVAFFTGQGLTYSEAVAILTPPAPMAVTA